MGVKFNPVRCTDGADRAFLRIEFPVTRREVRARLTYWHAAHRDVGELPATRVRKIVEHHFADHGNAGDGNDEWLTPDDEDTAWAERHTGKAWPDPADAKPCPHGCGLLDWIDDQWHCYVCGDEFAADPTTSKETTR